LDNFNDMLCQTVADILGTPRQLCIAIEKPECTPAVSVDRFPVVQAAALEKASPGCHWLIDRLWMAEAVGFLGAPPKSLKTWLALEMAVAVASGLPCLGTFSVSNPGPVLLYAAEDSVSAVRARLESIACHHRIALNQLALWVITAAMLRLDRPDDQQKLEATVAHYQPRLLVLDPLIRLHQLDENAAGPMAALLGFLRSLQRKTSMAIALVHHTRKNSAAAGYTLRGSSDFYAWTYVEVNISPLMCSLPLCAIALCSAINCQIHLPEHST
jgi:RecA-family ATPase